MIKRTTELKEAFDFASKYIGYGEVKIKKMGSLYVVTIDRQAELKQKIDALESMINEYQIHCLDFWEGINKLDLKNIINIKLELREIEERLNSEAKN